jgi:predicted phosphatase
VPLLAVAVVKDVMVPLYKFHGNIELEQMDIVTTMGPSSTPMILLQNNSYSTIGQSVNSGGMRSKHLPLNDSLTILMNIAPYDVYNGSQLKCNHHATYRQPELYWYTHSVTTTIRPVAAAVRRLLMVQSAGFGTYSQLLDLTAPVNKAYARRWGHTFLILQGSLVYLAEERKTNCTPPEHRSTHNKMQFVKFGLTLRDHYDYLLILDADAMIYDFERDISDLMPPTCLFAANRVVAKKGVKKRATWKINAGVTLWNLHHQYTAAVADQWTHAAVGFMNGRNNNQGDQLFLYHVLKNNASMEEQIYSLGKEFNYNKATVIKHVKRPALTYEIGQTALDSRAQVIEQFTREICLKYPTDCQGMDQTKYSAF